MHILILFYHLGMWTNVCDNTNRLLEMEGPIWLGEQCHWREQWWQVLDLEVGPSASLLRHRCSTNTLHECMQSGWICSIQTASGGWERRLDWALHSVSPVVCLAPVFSMPKCTSGWHRLPREVDSTRMRLMSQWCPSHRAGGRQRESQREYAGWRLDWAPSPRSSRPPPGTCSQ